MKNNSLVLKKKMQCILIPDYGKYLCTMLFYKRQRVLKQQWMGKLKCKANWGHVEFTKAYKGHQSIWHFIILTKHLSNNVRQNVVYHPRPSCDTDAPLRCSRFVFRFQQLINFEFGEYNMPPYYNYICIILKQHVPAIYFLLNLLDLCLLKLALVLLFNHKTIILFVPTRCFQKQVDLNLIYIFICCPDPAHYFGDVLERYCAYVWQQTFSNFAQFYFV